MRSDMAKVIVERPRKKGCASPKPKGYQRRLRCYGEDGPPQREGMKRRWDGRTKYLNEHLGPLRRYLDSQVGRPWDKVFSEICAHINRNSAVQDHVRDHVEDYVATHVILIDGIPCNREGGWNYGRPLHALHWRWYVCPRSGLLKRVQAPRKRQQGKTRRRDVPSYVRVGDALVCKLIDGAWHLVTVRPLPPPGHAANSRDVVLNRLAAEISPSQACKHYGAAVYAVAKRRLARRELRQYPIPIDAWV